MRWRIVGLVSIPVMLSGLAIGAFALYTSWHEIEEVYDAQLIHAAKVLRQLTVYEFRKHSSGDVELIPETRDLGYKYEQNIAFRIWRNEQPVTRSHNAVGFGDLDASPGLSDHRIDGERWRFFVLVDPDSGVTVETAERYGIRYELISYLLAGLLLPGSLFIPAVLALVWYGTSRGMKPLAALSRDVDNRDSGDLSRIESRRTPREIGPLVNALNRLLSRLREALERERDFTDNAAHELRTPLAAIKIQAQALRPRLSNLPECRESLANLLAAIDRAAHLVDQLLSFSRLQKEASEHTAIDLPALIEDAVTALAGDAANKGQELSVEVRGQPTAITGNRHALEIMVRNLLENAVKYTPPGGHITAGTERLDGHVAIAVRDDGPGIADSEKGRVLSRFYRVGGADNPGSGLGLAIVKWIADQHGAELVLADNAPRGLAAMVVFAAMPEPG